MELSGDKAGVARLLDARVVDQNGSRLGRVYELRGHYERDGSIVVDELLIGKTALLKRLRGPGPEAAGIPLDAVIEQGPERIVVRR